MEAAGAVARTVAFCSDAARDLRREFRGKGWARSSSVSMCPRRGFADEGHLRYYASKVPCGDVKKEEEKAIKRRMKLLKGSTALELVDGFLSVALVPGEIEERRMTITDAADALLAQLELLRSQEKQMKKKKMKKLEKNAAKQMKACEDSEDSGDEEENKTAAVLLRRGKDCNECKDSDHGEAEKKEEKKKEKKAKEAAAKQQMKDCCESEEDSSSSSSSESSDSDCEGERVDMKDLRTVPPAEEEPAVGDAQMEAPPMGAVNSAIAVGSIVEGRAERDDAWKPPALQIQCSSGIGKCLGSNTGACDGSSSSSSVVTGGDKPVNMGRIEVCMGGKCRKSGGMELMQEFERRVGSGGVVVGCKCMGKCREGPNVRLREVPAGDESGSSGAVPAKSPPLCLGVGLEDVGTLLANFFAEEDEVVGLLAA